MNLQAINISLSFFFFLKEDKNNLIGVMTTAKAQDGTKDKEDSE